MKSFATRYTPNTKVVSVMDSHDNVDRLSYVDSTQMVKRMIFEGQNLMAYRAAALRGMYSSDELGNLGSEEGLPAIPVYETDPVIGKQIIDGYKEVLGDVHGKQDTVISGEFDTPTAGETKVDAPSGE